MSESKEEKRELRELSLQEIHQKQVQEQQQQLQKQQITDTTTINGGNNDSGNLLVKLLSKRLFSCADQDRAVYSMRTDNWICRRCTMENDGWAGQCHVCEGFHDESDGEMWTNVEELQEIKNIQARMVTSDTDRILKDLQSRMVLLLFGKSFSTTSSNLFRTVAEWYRKGGNKVCEVVYLPDDYKEDGGFAFTHHFRLMPWYASLIRYQDEKTFPQSVEFLQLDNSIRDLPSAWLFNSDGKLIGRDIQNKILNGSAFPWKSSTIIDILQIPEYPLPMKQDMQSAKPIQTTLSSTPPPSLSSQPPLKETVPPLPPQYLAVYVAQMGKGKEVVKPFLEQLKKFHSKHSQLLDVMVLPADEILGTDWADEITKMQDVLNTVYSQAGVWTLTSIGDSRVRLLKNLVGVLSAPKKQSQPPVQTLQPVQPQMLHQLLIVDRRTAHVMSRDGVRGIEQDPDASAFPWIDKWSLPPAPVSTITTATTDNNLSSTMAATTSATTEIQELGLENVNQFFKKVVLLRVTSKDRNRNQREEILAVSKFSHQCNQQGMVMIADVSKHKYLLKQLAKEFLPPIETSSGKNVLDELGTGYFIFDFPARSVFFPKSTTSVASTTTPVAAISQILDPLLFVTTYLCDSKTLLSKKIPTTFSG